MRQLLIQVPRGCGSTVLDIAQSCQGTHLIQFEATGIEQLLDGVLVAASLAPPAGLMGMAIALGRPNLQRSSITQRANTDIQTVVKNSGLAKIVEANIRFTRPDIPEQNTLLATIYVQKNSDISESNEAISTRLTQMIQNQLLQKNYNVTPLIEVNVLEQPS